jgi:hypothetical protein
VNKEESKTMIEKLFPDRITKDEQEWCRKIFVSFGESARESIDKIAYDLIVGAEGKQE